MIPSRFKRMVGVAVACLGLAMPSLAGNGEKNPKADSRLAGTWTVSWARTSGTMSHRLAEADELSFSSAGDLVHTHKWRTGGGSYVVTPASPDAIDITINAIGAKGVRGIYRFHGENLILCVSEEGNDSRPAEFELTPGSNRALLVLQRSRFLGRNKKDADAMLAQFRDHADEFEITLTRHAAGKSKFDLISITLHSSNRKFEPSPLGPSGQPFFKSARITKDQALRLMEAIDGWPASFFRNAQDVSEPLRERPPFFSTRISYGPDAKPGPHLHLPLDWGWHTIAYFGNLAKAVDGEAAKLIGEFQGGVQNDRDPANRVKAPAKAEKNLNVLLVNGKPAADRFDTATEYLHLTLRPAPDKGPDKIRPRVVNANQFQAPEVLQKLQDWDCIFLCDVPQLTMAQIKALETYVERGGGVVVCLGPRVNLEAYNANLYRGGKGLLPVKLLERREAKQDHDFAFAVADDAFKEPPLAEFNEQADRLTLLAPMFRSFIRVANPDKDIKAHVIATFAETPRTKGARPTDAGIAMIEWQPRLSGKERARGRVVLLTSTVNMDWTNWPGSPSFLPMAHELLRFAAANKDEDTRKR